MKLSFERYNINLFQENEIDDNVFDDFWEHYKQKDARCSSREDVFDQVFQKVFDAESIQKRQEWVKEEESVKTGYNVQNEKDLFKIPGAGDTFFTKEETENIMSLLSFSSSIPIAALDNESTASTKSSDTLVDETGPTHAELLTPEIIDELETAEHVSSTEEKSKIDCGSKWSIPKFYKPSRLLGSLKRKKTALPLHRSSSTCATPLVRTSSFKRAFKGGPKRETQRPSMKGEYLVSSVPPSKPGETAYGVKHVKIDILPRNRTSKGITMVYNHRGQVMRRDDLPRNLAPSKERVNTNKPAIKPYVPSKSYQQNELEEVKSESQPYEPRNEDERIDFNENTSHLNTLRNRMEFKSEGDDLRFSLRMKLDPARVPTILDPSPKRRRNQFRSDPVIAHFASSSA